MSGQWLCKPCHVLFPSFEALQAHRDEQRNAGAAQHIVCKKCGDDLVDDRHEFIHLQRCHGKDQELWCPGCGGGSYSNLGAFMEHIEKKECGVLTLARLEKMRADKRKFTLQLVELTGEPVKNDFWNYVTDLGFSNSYEGHGQQQQSQGERSQLIEHGDWLKLGPKEQDGNTPTQSEAAPLSVFDRPLDKSDPSHPAFNVSSYYYPTTDKYRCPRPGCGKSFPKPRALISHLQGSAHSNRSYRCPACLRCYKSLQAIASHVESSDVRCHIRKTNNFGAYIDQLTGGLVEVQSSRHDDGSVKYRTTMEGVQRLKDIIGGIPGHDASRDKENMKGME